MTNILVVLTLGSLKEYDLHPNSVLFSVTSTKNTTITINVWGEAGLSPFNDDLCNCCQPYP